MRAKCARTPPVRLLTADRKAHDPNERMVAGKIAVSRQDASRDALTVSNLLAIAGLIEPDPAAVLQWYGETTIASLGGLTAEALVTQGRAGDVLSFLLTALDNDG